MKMRSPIVAMLWENWRLTRVEAAQRFGLGIVAGSGAMALLDAGATAAFWILIVQHGMIIWLSIAKLNGGRFLDGYKPGFPFYLLYTRPVPTVVFVGVAMMYDALSCAALYLISAALLGFAFRQPLPLFSVILWIVTVHLCYACIQWSTASRVVQWVGSIAFVLLFFLLENRVASPLQVEFSLVENALMVLICVVAFGLTIAGVARQRRGDAIASAPRTEGLAGYPDWLVTLFRFRCPTSSATRAQVWFELKSSGLPALAIGLGVATLIFLLFAISIPFGIVRPMAIGILMFAAPALLLLLGGNAFGIRRRQGRTYASAFEMTRPYGIAQMVGLKVLVRTACVLAALTAVGLSAWASSSLLGAWGTWVVEGGKDAVPGLLKQRQEFGDAFEALAGYSRVALALIASVTIAVMVALFATFAAVRARYPRPLLITGSLLLFHGLVLVLLALAEQENIASPFLVQTFFAVTGWTLVTAIAFATIYLFWNGFAERALTVRYASAAVLVSAIFGAAWLTVLQAGGVQISEMSAGNAVSVLWPVLLPLMASVLAPWSLNRVRHT
jgi:hypothetical protein